MEGLEQVRVRMIAADSCALMARGHRSAGYLAGASRPTSGVVPDRPARMATARNGVPCRVVISRIDVFPLHQLDPSSTDRRHRTDPVYTEHH